MQARNDIRLHVFRVAVVSIMIKGTGSRRHSANCVPNNTATLPLYESRFTGKQSRLALPVKR